MFTFVGALHGHLCDGTAFLFIVGAQPNYLHDLLDRFSPFLPHGRYFIVHAQTDPLFQISQETLPRQPIFGAKSVKLAYSPSFVTLAFRNGLKYCNANSHVYTGDDLATSCKNLMNFDVLMK